MTQEIFVTEIATQSKHMGIGDLQELEKIKKYLLEYNILYLSVKFVVSIPFLMR
jgi:hypothetical protein